MPPIIASIANNLACIHKLCLFNSITCDIIIAKQDTLVNTNGGFTMKANEDIRREMRALNVPFWALAHAWGCNETTAIRQFRVELSPEDKARVLNLIRQVARDRGEF